MTGQWDDMPAEHVRVRGGYRSFLVRCWAVGGTPKRPSNWRLLVQEVGSEPTRRAFAGVDALAAYLHMILEGEHPDGEDTGSGEDERE